MKYFISTLLGLAAIALAVGATLPAKHDIRIAPGKPTERPCPPKCGHHLALVL